MLDNHAHEPDPSDPNDPIEFLVEEADHQQRLDVFLAKRLPQYSRTHLRRAIDAGTVLVDNERTKVAYRLVTHQRVVVVLPDLPRESPVPENIPLDILYEDDHLVAINKPPGMVVHPARGHWAGTLTSALAFHFSSLSSIGGPTRPGIVHRLDRDTSGVMVVAKTDTAHSHLAAQFENRTVFKQYVAICRGSLDRDRDIIRKKIGPHAFYRERMAVRDDHVSCRDAVTEYEVFRRYRGFTWVHAFPKTGRTHQIRVHLAHIGYPVVCDRLYASHSRLMMGDVSGQRSDESTLIERQALHACMLKVEHPATNQSLLFEAPLPTDIAKLTEALDQYRSS